MTFIKKTPTIKKRWVALILLFIVINFYQLPYYFTKPGEAKVLDTIIEVEGGNEDEGEFMLTTVRMGKANIVNYLWAKYSDSWELIHEDLIRRSGETDAEYHHRQIVIMSSSQDIATIVAYKHAGANAYYDNYGVIVTGTINEMSAHELLQIGDVIVSVDNEEITTVEQLLDKLGRKTIGDTVPLGIIRDEEQLEVTLTVSKFPKEVDPTGERVGVGITGPMTKRELQVDPEVLIDTEKIGGPSAGLMFSLEIYNQLVEQDISKGYKIAGTGSINDDEIVGRIGGVKQKVIAAERAGADFFLAPNESGDLASNYHEAVEVAHSLNLAIEVIPIDTFTDALEFLDTLQPKKS